MTATKGKISDIIQRGSEYSQLLKASEKARKPRPAKEKQSHIGHYLAVMFYDKEENHLETLFLDHIDIFRRFTFFIFDKEYYEVVYWEKDHSVLEGSRLKVYYKNGFSIDVIRIS